MTRNDVPGLWLRRARPALGTLVEVGVPVSDASTANDAEIAIGAAFAAIAQVQACLSRFEPASDVARFNAAASGARLCVSSHTRRVLGAARRLQLATEDLFDITLRSAPRGWRCVSDTLHKLDTAARIDLGGIGKGYAVDQAVHVLRDAGCASGWINAGGDLRAFGCTRLAVIVRDEKCGGGRPFATLRSGAFATSRFGPGSRDDAIGARRVAAHVSVAAPRCIWADALTKVVAISGNASHPALQRFGASAWMHA